LWHQKSPRGPTEPAKESCLTPRKKGPEIPPRGEKKRRGALRAEAKGRTPLPTDGPRAIRVNGRRKKHLHLEKTGSPLEGEKKKKGFNLVATVHLHDGRWGAARLLSKKQFSPKVSSHPLTMCDEGEKKGSLEKKKGSPVVMKGIIKLPRVNGGFKSSSAKGGDRFP